MIYLRDFGLPENPQSREEQLCVNYEHEKRQKKILVKVMDEIFLDCGYVETMTFLYTIIILKVGPLSYNIKKKIYMVPLFENRHYKPKINIIDPN